MTPFRGLNPEVMNLKEIEKELAYQTKRLYRLRKLKRMGKDVEPHLSACQKREAELDLEHRRRLIAIADIPF